MLKFNSLYKAYTSKSSKVLDVGSVILLKQLTIQEKLSIEEIKIFLNISNTKLKKIITQLKLKSFVEFSKDSSDGRRKLVNISYKGRLFLEDNF